MLQSCLNPRSAVVSVPTLEMLKQPVLVPNWLAKVRVVSAAKLLVSLLWTVIWLVCVWLAVMRRLIVVMVLVILIMFYRLLSCRWQS